uniref:Uncharacterized protein n=1 Tax=Anguilla anguilla TaxID=7936 RepID=A0A0E9RYS5_ANGAN
MCSQRWSTNCLSTNIPVSRAKKRGPVRPAVKTGKKKTFLKMETIHSLLRESGRTFRA